MCISIEHMFKFKFTVLVLCFGMTTLHSQITCNIIDNYADFIHVKRYDDGKRKFISKNVIKSQKDACYSTLINDNTMFIYYILSGFSSEENNATLLEITDEKEFQDTYFLDLSKDDKFNSIMNELVSKTLTNTQPKDSVTMDALLNVAVKYFSIVRIMDDGKYIGKVAVGLNDIKKTLNQRKPFLEAFAWAAILANKENNNFQLDNEFKTAINEIEKIELGISQDDRLLRAQGAMYMMMYNNPQLRNVLRTEYENHQAYLPFVLVY